MTQRTAILALLAIISVAVAASLLLPSSTFQGMILAATGAVSALLLIPAYGGESAWNELMARARAITTSE